MTTIAIGPVTRAYVEIEDLEIDIGQTVKAIDRIVLRLGDDQWIELRGISLLEENGFQLPEPIGDTCSVSEIADRGWGNRRFEIEFASGYSREGVFWAESATRLSGPPTIA